MARTRLTAFAVLMGLAAAPGPALGEDGFHGIVHELKVGVLAHDVGNIWSGFKRESGADINFEVVFTPSVPLLEGTLRPALGASINTGGDTSKVYLDARWEHELGSGYYLTLGAGVAAHDGERDLVRNDRKALGSSVLFHFPVEFGYRIDGHNGVSVYFDHISNAYLADENEGLDTLGIRYGYRF